MTNLPDSDGTYEVVIPDSVMKDLKDAPPHVIDDLADTIAQIRRFGPEAVTTARAATPHPVDHSPGRPPVYVPPTRSVSYLRNAVAEISPPTVQNFDQELRTDTLGDSPDARIRGLRQFIVRWVEYIAVHGDHDLARELNNAPDHKAFARLYSEANAALRRRYFPDANGSDFSVRCYQDGQQWIAVDPVTMLRYARPTEQEARDALRGGLLEMVTGY